MGSFLSKLFRYVTQSTFDSQITAIGVHATDNSNVTCGDITVIGSPGKPPNRLHVFPVCSKFFCGRVLRQVKESIILCEKEKSSLQRIVAITGFGGMGKSEIVKVLAEELQSKYEYIFWFDAQTKTSLESRLKQFAGTLKIPCTSQQRTIESVLWDVYHSLAENYKNGILIFDNVEVLKAEEGNFALETYLLPDLQCNKPVFLVTSRNTMGSERDGIKCVYLNRLSDEESLQCMLKFLGIETHALPPSLKKDIISLVKMLEGHPLGLSLLGQGLYTEVDSIHLNKTLESWVKSYTELFEASRRKDVPGKSTYEDNLQLITDLAIEKLLKTDKGKIAVELLNIVTLLSPDDIHAGLVNGIYCEKPFETNPILCSQFVWEDLETTVRSGLKLLQSSSLLKIESTAYENNGYQHKYEMIKIHRMIQQSAQNRLLRQNELIEPLEKILGFTEQIRLSLDHVGFLLRFCLRNRLAHLHPEVCCLQILGAHLNLSSLYLIEDQFSYLKGLYLYKYQGTVGQGAMDLLKRSVMELSPEFSIQRWLLELVMLILDNFQSLHVPRENYGDFVIWVVKNYTHVKDGSRRDLPLIKFVRRHDPDTSIEIPTPSTQIILAQEISNQDRDWSKVGELVLKVFDCTSESWRGFFWQNVLRFIDGDDDEDSLPKKQREQFVQCLITSPGTICLSRSLQFSQDSFKYRFIATSRGFVGCVEHITHYPELRASLLATKGFVSSLWDLTEFGFRKISSSWEYMNNIRDTYCFNGIAGGLGNLVRTWCRFFVDDVDLYGRFGEKLDSEVENLLECPWDKKSIYKLSSLLFAKSAEYCIKKFSETLEYTPSIDGTLLIPDPKLDSKAFGI